MSSTDAYARYQDSEGPFYWARRKEKGGLSVEVSSKGDKRFSAFWARLGDGRNIECHYQCDVKGYDPGGVQWKLGKGQPPLRTDVDLWQAYLNLWRRWKALNPSLFMELTIKAQDAGYLLTDCHANTPCNQARALCELLNEHHRSQLH